jgi:hypothetical protein
VIVYVAQKPDKSPLGIYPDMGAAQAAIAVDEPCIIKQGLYQIHPISSQKDADALKLKINIHYCLEKFDGDYAGQQPVEVLEGVG